MLRNIGIEGEVLIFHLMDINGIGPKLLGVFDGGRIEQFLEGYDQLSNEDCANPDVMARFARKLAKLHSLKVPVKKTPKNLVRIIRDNFEKHWPNYRDFMIEREYPPGTTEEMKKAVQFSIDYDWFKLIDWFEQTLSTVRTRVVFTHNDMNRANCMVHPTRTDEDKLVLLDFEFCGYNHRGCDIGHHFKNRSIDVKKFTEGENAFDSTIPYPSEEERRHFVKAYLEIAKESYDDPDESLDNEDQLLLEAEFYGGLYALFFTSFMLCSIEQFRHVAFPIHPGVLMASFIQDYEARQKNTMDLCARLEGLKLN
jgi:choline/ethanolamine kinase